MHEAGRLQGTPLTSNALMGLETIRRISSRPSPFVQRTPTYELGVRAGLTLVPCVHNECLDIAIRRGQQGSHAPSAVEEIRRRGHRRLRLYDLQSVRPLDNKVALDAIAISVERYAGRFAGVCAVLDDLGYDACFEDRAAERVGAELVGGSDAEQPAGQSRCRRSAAWASSPAACAGSNGTPAAGTR